MRSPAGSLLGRLRRSRRRLGAALGSVLGSGGLDLVYDQRYQLDLPGVDSQRGARILAALDGAGLLRERAIHRAETASFRDLRRVHADAYLDSLARPAALLPIFGLELPEHLAESAMLGQRAMAGGTRLASDLALASGGFAANLGGGLHHAFSAKGERFCIFNDVAVAIAGLRADGFAGSVLVVDLDLHDDDGTRSIFAADPSVHTFSIHNRTTTEIPAVAATALELGGEVDDAAYLAAIDAWLPPALAASRPALVYYLAGCDPAADDAIGNWRISPAGMLRRDRRVIELVRRTARRPPVVILLAGGYGQQAWRYSARFLSSLRPGGRAIEPPTTAEVTLSRYRQLTAEPAGAVGGRRESAAGHGEADWTLSNEDLLGNLGGPQRPQRLLGACSRQELELLLERAGLLARLRQLGFPHPVVAFDLEHPGGETVRVHGAGDRRELLAELRLRTDRRTAPGLALLRIEWLLLQNPRAAFTPARRPLPGQDHPGLGLLRDLIALLAVASERMQLDGLLWVPAHYHTAAQGRRTSRFLRPEDDGTYRALERTVAGLPLPAAARAVEEGWVLDGATGAPFAWRPMPMVAPASARLRRQLDSDEYQRLAQAAAEHAFRLAEGFPPPDLPAR